MNVQPASTSKMPVAGKSGLGVRYVLIGGLALVIVIFIVLALVLSRTG